MFLKVGAHAPPVGRGNILVGHEDSELMNQYMITFIVLPFKYSTYAVYTVVSPIMVAPTIFLKIKVGRGTKKVEKHWSKGQVPIVVRV